MIQIRYTILEYLDVFNHFHSFKYGRFISYYISISSRYFPLWTIMGNYTFFNTKKRNQSEKDNKAVFFLPENPATAGTFFLGTVFHYFHLETAGCEQEAKFGRMAQYCEPWLRERSDISQHLHKIGCKQVRRRNMNLKNPRLKDLLSALSTLYSRQGRQAASNQLTFVGIFFMSGVESDQGCTNAMAVLDCFQFHFSLGVIAWPSEKYISSVQTARATTSKTPFGFADFSGQGGRFIKGLWRHLKILQQSTTSQTQY